MEATRWGFLKLADAGVSLLRPDVSRCGGPTEFAKIAHLAAARGLAVVPRPCGVFAYTMAMALPNVPVAEVALDDGDEDAGAKAPSDAVAPHFGDLFVDEPAPVAGYVALPPDRPGWGLTLNKDSLDLVRPYDRAAKNSLLLAFKTVTNECKNPANGAAAQSPATKGKRSNSAPSAAVRDESVIAADRALAASLLG